MVFFVVHEDVVHSIYAYMHEYALYVYVRTWVCTSTRLRSVFLCFHCHFSRNCLWHRQTKHSVVADVRSDRLQWRHVRWVPDGCLRRARSWRPRWLWVEHCQGTYMKCGYWRIQSLSKSASCKCLFVMNLFIFSEYSFQRNKCRISTERRVHAQTIVITQCLLMLLYRQHHVIR